ncbi:MAG: hypothetical protein V3S01_00880 [Dehalococcoidia bacterium]
MTTPYVTAALLDTIRGASFHTGWTQAITERLEHRNVVNAAGIAEVASPARPSKATVPVFAVQPRWRRSSRKLSDRYRLALLPRRVALRPAVVIGFAAVW